MNILGGEGGRVLSFVQEDIKAKNKNRAVYFI